MLFSNRCDQASSTASTRDVTPPSHIQRLHSRRALCFTPLSYCLCYIEISPCRRGSKESFSKINNGQFG
ncbi:hypothetical protein F2Q69_00044050 [Brassica cretica]|uniref:Uncharacterized protein n=2 Tax=Brassica cretica TaxID=69181 RepID=A0A8S9NAZ5_BRACR|nr:hypothetical protein F2Q69_00044050 [Brassica cretica]KAF3568316.1 hypothetical protein DY000_02017754 [Brassica cretica]